jgi:hypothetical protein
MSRKTVRSYRGEMPKPPQHSSDHAEARQALRKKQLARVLSHQGRIDLDLHPETLAQLRSAE